MPRCLRLLAIAAALARAAADPAPDLGRTVELPPIFVEATQQHRPHWRYARASDCEVLSACDDDLTVPFTDQVRERAAQLRQFVPATFLGGAATPTTLILLPKSLEKSLNRGLADELNRVGAEGFHASYGVAAIPHLRLNDFDSTDIFVVLDDENPDGRAGPALPSWGAATLSDAEPPKSQIVLLPSYVSILLQWRAPALPQWFTAAMTQIYAANRYTDEAAHWMVCEPLQWPDAPSSPPPAGQSKRGPPGPSPLLPATALFAFSPPPGSTEAYCGVWRAEAELFVRWAASGRIPNGKARLFRLAELAAEQPMTEARFESCFGLSYPGLEHALADYLPRATSRPLQWCELTWVPLERLRLHDATPEEIHAVSGEWGRRVLRVVRQQFPDMLPVYVEEARRALETPYAQGERSPGLVSSVGLLRADLGDEAGALAALAEAAATGQARPLALLELARLRLLAALRHPGGAGGCIGDAQAAAILAPVAEAIREGPPCPAAYALAAGVAEHLARPPTPAELSRLNEGARFYPGDFLVDFEAAYWDVRRGDRELARHILELGAWEATNPGDRQRLAALERLVPAPTPVSTK